MDACAAPPSVPPDISPSRGEIRWSAGTSQIQKASNFPRHWMIETSGCREFQIFHLEEEMSRSDRGEYAASPSIPKLPGKNITWL